MITAVFVLWAAALVGLTLALLTTPRWVVRSIHRHRLWRFRDELVDGMLDGSVPHHPATFELLDRIEATIDGTDEMHLLDVLAMDRLMRRAPEDTQRQILRTVRPCPLEGLTSEECERVATFRNRLHTLQTGLILLGSWIGIATVMLRIPKSTRIAWSHANVARQSLRIATDETATESRLGRRILEVVNGPGTPRTRIA